MGTRMNNKLCGEDVCDINHCPAEPFHCEHGLMVMMAEAEMRAELRMDEIVDDPFGDKPVGFR